MQLNRISSAICHLVMSFSHFLLVCGCAALLRAAMNFVFSYMHWTKLHVKKSFSFMKNSDLGSLKIYSKLVELLSNLALHFTKASTVLIFNSACSLFLSINLIRPTSAGQKTIIQATHKKTTPCFRFLLHSSPKPPRPRGWQSHKSHVHTSDLSYLSVGDWLADWRRDFYELEPAPLPCLPEMS